ncbi:MAG: phosphoenolpyruvate--protein phosphotransferase [Cellvibrionaceae bacterium]
MLQYLSSIVQEVGVAKDLQSVLEIIVERVKSAMKTDVCSIYLRDGGGKYLLMASRGLNASAVGHVRLSRDEGLIGWVVGREEPINLDDAESHPRYQYFPETGEERFSSFLGVPIIHHRAVLGVLVVQQTERRRFDESDEAFLVTISAQLAGAIAHAEATGALAHMGRQAKESSFKGVAGAPGVAMGKAMVITPVADLNSVPHKKITDIDAEIQFLKLCLAETRREIENLGEKLKSRLSTQEQALFDAYVSMLDDSSLAGEVIEHIKKGDSAAYAWSEVILIHVRNFSSMEDAYLRERAADVSDLGRRVLAHLQEFSHVTRVYPKKTILVGEELTASQLGEVPEGQLAGIVSVKGSHNSHIAIMARAMGIPTIVGAVDLPYKQIDGRELVIDGYNGVVYSDPGPELRKRYEDIFQEEQELEKDLEALNNLPCESIDHHRITLWVNTGLMADVVRSLERGAEGVGLYRTEVPFLLRDRFPSEEEQRIIYREQLEAFHPHPVTMRTLDIGGDKSLPYFPIEEDNPFLGWRGIRVTLDHPEIFLSQVRAMLKASEGLNNLRIMLPMITSISELEGAKKLVYRAYHELLEENYTMDLPPIGVMIEVPAAVYQARELASRSDFLSVGSNDLTQYLLAVDRNNARVSDLYHSFHPAVIRALQYIVHEGHSQAIPVSICGEMAGDPGAAILLAAMGFDVLSMNATNLPKVKSAIRSIKIEEAEILLKKVLTFSDADEVSEAVNEALTDAGITRMLRPTRAIH